MLTFYQFSKLEACMLVSQQKSETMWQQQVLVWSSSEKEKPILSQHRPLKPSWTVTVNWAPDAAENTGAGEQMSGVKQS